MPRRARIDAPGALHHIISRGIERRKIFRDDQDRYAFIQRLDDIITQTGTVCFAWALIPNHFHLLLRTGSRPIADVMRRLLTGHAIYFNRRHRRSGHLFQNRYKSILCQQDVYLLELVRYIHLNPLRARQVKDMDQLGKYPFSGHGVLMGKRRQPWQDIGSVLTFFDDRTGPARRKYRAYVTKAIGQGRRDDLVGGGLVRSAGGWTAVKAIRAQKTRMKGDERILGDGDFVNTVLQQCDEALDEAYKLQANGVDLDFIAHRVAHLLDMPPDDVWLPGRSRRLVTSRSLLCYWGVRKLNLSMAELGRRLGISTVAVSKSVRRGMAIAKKNQYDLTDS